MVAGEKVRQKVFVGASSVTTPSWWRMFFRFLPVAIRVPVVLIISSSLIVYCVGGEEAVGFLLPLNVFFGFVYAVADAAGDACRVVKQAQDRADFFSAIQRRWPLFFSCN